MSPKEQREFFRSWLIICLVAGVVFILLCMIRNPFHGLTPPGR